jgi:hypothetical protein
MFSYLLSLHEALREEVAGLSLALTDLDGRASMAVMNESHRIKEDMAPPTPQSIASECKFTG